MEFLKGIFNGQSLTQEEFEAAAQNGGLKLFNLADGGYVSKAKYDDDIKARDTTITDLRGQLAKAGTEKTAEEWQAEIDALNAKASDDKQKYDAAIAKEQYKALCKDYARDIRFTSKGAENAFINAMIAKNMEQKDGELVGADDFRKEYEKKDPNSFMKDNKNPRIIDRQKAPADQRKLTLTELMKKANENQK